MVPRRHCSKQNTIDFQLSTVMGWDHYKGMTIKHENKKQMEITGWPPARRAAQLRTPSDTRGGRHMGSLPTAVGGGKCAVGHMGGRDDSVRPFSTVMWWRPLLTRCLGCWDPLQPRTPPAATSTSTVHFPRGDDPQMYRITKETRGDNTATAHPSVHEP
ncbi:hypothetical protein OPV22_010641 [Ensete ventricosum]|uniref:Uncharacterized protein n=1 Tax=Ensete ventricosum TaxID=4639 RepID=A0AAV8RDJ2_ENSVE|nr:hypothetical protein OPV22_010641 [Ensete ventricosum]